ncbi:heme-copper oxidase subunit III [Paenimyroides tangerinum]|uniref:Heme-copper oxidase subunit III n=1 Tax=Paenimyroides tangerinum TaxID=2488728 RepID=A0A3P3WDQ9_9FLAO|nr:cytochrome c oxidase subunit 3 [Paenimyroides tangerinum]RRJ93291.1 heme-copper oxidase subunit III [Paenimyroides tangerinum]
MNTLEINKEREKKEKAYKTMLFLGMGSIVMIFAALTSAYVVSKSRPDWLAEFNLPSAFLYSTIIMIVSSVTFHMAKVAIKKNNRNLTSICLGLTLFFGIVFIALQFEGFSQIVSEGYYFTGSESNITTSFLYVLVLVHMAHIIGALISLLIVIYNHYKQRYNSTQSLGIELGAMFWHFLDFLWLYLFLFFTFYN